MTHRFVFAASMLVTTLLVPGSAEAAATDGPSLSSAVNKATGSLRTNALSIVMLALGIAVALHLLTGRIARAVMIFVFAFLPVFILSNPDGATTFLVGTGNGWMQ